MIARIRDRDAFVRLRRRGVRLRVDPLWCSYLHDPQDVPAHVAFAIGRAVGPAVTRNRLRRRLRAILRSLDVPPGLVLIGATPRVNELTFAQLTDCTVELVASMRAKVPA